MTSSLTARLAAAGIILPEAAAPAANYVPFVRVGDMLHVSGQLPGVPGALITGQLGGGLALEEGVQAARACALNLLGQVRAACDGDIDGLIRVVKITGFVNSAPDFGDQPKVVNGASDFLVEALGDAGRHARSAVGVSALPFGVAVEIEGLFQIR